MNKQQRLYAIFLNIAGIVVFGATLYLMRDRIFALIENPDMQVIRGLLGYLLILAAFRSLPIYMPGDRKLDLSFLAALFVALMEGPLMAIALFALSTPLVFAYDPEDKQYKSVFSFPAVRVLFNTAFFIIPMFFAHFALPGQPAPLSNVVEIEAALLPTVLYCVIALVLMMAELMILDRLERRQKPRSIVEDPATIYISVFVGAVGGVGSACLQYVLPSGGLLWGLLLIPLLAMRYATGQMISAQETLISLIGGIVDDMEKDDPFLAGHSRRVQYYSETLAYRMKLSPARMENLRVAALLHDIGRVHIDPQILNKSGGLTAEETEAVQQHPEWGAMMVEHLPLDPIVEQVVAHHHERYDGMGYPSHVQLAEYPVEVGIVSAAEAFDAMTSDRPFRKAMDSEKAVSIFREESGRQFHPEVVFALAQRAPWTGYLRQP